MKKVIIISLAIIALMSLVLTVTAFAQYSKSKGTQLITSEGENLFVSSPAKGEVKVKRVGSERSYLGVYLDDVDDRVRQKHNYPNKIGALVSKVVDDSPADEAGLQRGDIIYVFDGEKVSNASELVELVGDREPGDKVGIVFYRDGEKKEVEIELTERSYYSYSVDLDDLDKFSKEIGNYYKGFDLGRNIRFFGGAGNRLGVELLELDENLAGYFDVGQDDGVLVIGVKEDGPAEEAGMRTGDVIVSVQGARISDIDDIGEELADLEEGLEAEIKIKRHGKEMALKVELAGEDRFGFQYIFPQTPAYRIAIPRDEWEDEGFSIDIKKKDIEKHIKELEKELKKLEERLKKMEEDD